MSKILDKIVSGGQTGADIGGLKAAKALGIATGGWVPKGCITQSGPNPALVEEYGCVEHTSDKYSPRTFSNARDSDATIRFAKFFNSAGERCTFNAIIKYRKPHLDVDVKNPPEPEEVKKWLVENNIRVLNVAGNSEKTCPGMEKFVVSYLMWVLQ